MAGTLPRTVPIVGFLNTGGFEGSSGFERSDGTGLPYANPILLLPFGHFLLIPVVSCLTTCSPRGTAEHVLPIRAIRPRPEQEGRAAMCSHCEITVPPRREHRPEATGSMARPFSIPSPAPSASHDRLGDPKVLCTTTATTSCAQSRSGRKVLYVQYGGNGSHVLPRAVRYGPRGQRRVARRPHRCHRPMSLPCPRMGGISSPEAIGQQRKRRVYAKPFLAPEAFQLVRGRPFSRMPASVDGEDYGVPSITWFSRYYELLLWQKARRFGCSLRG